MYSQDGRLPRDTDDVITQVAVDVMNRNYDTTVYSKRTSGQSANLSGHCQQTVIQRLSTLLIPKFFFINAQWDFLCILDRGEMMLFHCKHNPRCDVATVVRLATRSLGVVACITQHQ